MSDPGRRHRRARDVFVEASALPIEARPDFLRQACGDDDELMHEVESLLGHREGPLGDRTTGATRFDAILDEHPAMIGPYRIVRLIGEGGMGRVYEADQDAPVRRRVAIKAIKLGMDTRAVVARFEAERQMLAMLSHPAVAQVFDAGSTDDGRPYFAMEMVEGVPISQFCDAHHLGVGPRLELFAKVCAGVQHAHRRGVIHRDLKPGNILVTGDGAEAQPKIIDFGIAKATAPDGADGTLLTVAGELIGTPEYMSPEQAAADGAAVDTRTDVYALGVVLYELLTGVRLFDPEVFARDGLDGLRRAIREIDPPPPSARFRALAASFRQPIAAHRAVDPVQLARLLRGDLDWIVMRALEKDADRRYQAPSELADDLRRHADHRPVNAGPPSPGYRASKFLRRHRVGVAAAAVALLAVSIGAGAAAVGFLRALDAEREAVEEAARARQAADFVLGLFRGFDPRSLQDMTLTAGDVLDAAVARVDTELAGQPEIQAEVLGRLADIYTTRGDNDRARPLFERSLAIYRELHGDEHPDVARTLAGLGWLEYNDGDYRRSLALLQGAVESSRPVGDDLQTSRYVGSVGMVLRHLGELDQATDHLERALEVQQRLLGTDALEVINTRSELALVEIATGDPGAARTHLESALAARRATTGPDNLAVAAAALQLGVFLADQDAPDEAEAHILSALDVRRRALDADHPDIAAALAALAAVRLDQGRDEEALELYRESLDIRVAALGPDHPAVAGDHRGLGRYYENAGDFDTARAHYETAIGILEAALGPDHADLANVLHRHGAALMGQGDTQGARTSLERALAIRETTLPADDVRVARTLERLAAALRTAGETELAERAEARAAAIRSNLRTAAPGR